MSCQSWEHLTSVLVDTGIFISWFRGDRDAQRFFRDPGRKMNLLRKVTRKELLREPIRTSEVIRIKAFLNRFLRYESGRPDCRPVSELSRQRGIRICEHIPRMPLLLLRLRGKKIFRC